MFRPIQPFPMAILLLLIVLGCDETTPGHGEDAGNRDDAQPDIALDLMDTRGDVDLRDSSQDPELMDSTDTTDLPDPLDPEGVSCHQPLLIVRTEGGLTPHGAAFSEVHFHRDGYVVFDDESPSTPVEGRLRLEDLSELNAAVTAVDPHELSDGYGECCNAWADGSDTYLVFPSSMEREVRISDTTEAPAELIELLEAAMEAWETIEGGSSTITSPLLLDLPDYTAGSCTVHIDRGPVRVRLSGSDGTVVDPDEMAADGSPITAEARGVVTSEPGEELSFASSDGTSWTLEFLNYPSDLPTFSAPPGHNLIVTVVQEIVGEGGVAQGLVIRDGHGVVFAADSGLVDIAADSPDLSVRIVDGGCPQEDRGYLCHPAGEEAFQLGEGDDARIVYPGEWAHLTFEGHDLAFTNLRSFSTGLCDDIANYAWAAFALTGSHLCEGSCRADLDCEPESYCNPCAQSSCPTCTDCVPACVPHGCESESVLDCDTIRPDCGASSVAIIRDGCWSCVDRDTCEPTGSLHPIDFVVSNEGSESVFFDLTWSGSQVSVQLCSSDTDCEDQLFWRPFCVLSCDSVDPDHPESCCIDCSAPMPQAVEIGPGESWIIPWDGENSYSYDGETCECGCYRTRSPSPGDYEVTACVADDVRCLSGEPCRPGENGTPFNADLADRECYVQSFTLPTSADEVVIPVDSTP